MAAQEKTENMKITSFHSQTTSADKAKACQVIGNYKGTENHCPDS